MKMDTFLAHFNEWRKMYAATLLTLLTLFVNYYINLPEGTEMNLKDILRELWPAVAAGFGAGVVANKVNGQNVLDIAKKSNVQYRSHWVVGILAIAVSLLMVEGCTVNPYKDVKVDSSNKGIVVANAELRSANLLLQEIIKAGVIKADDAEKVADIIKARRSDLRRAAVAVAMTGDPMQADDALGKAATGFALVMELLAPYLSKMDGTPVAYINHQPEMRLAA